MDERQIGLYVEESIRQQSTCSMRFIHLARRMYRNGASYTYTKEETLPLLMRRILRPEIVLQHGRVRMRLLAAGGGEASGRTGLKQNGGPAVQ